jgi:hypothetical protein
MTASSTATGNVHLNTSVKVVTAPVPWPPAEFVVLFCVLPFGSGEEAGVGIDAAIANEYGRN